MILKHVFPNGLFAYRTWGRIIFYHCIIKCQVKQLLIGANLCWLYNIEADAVESCYMYLGLSRNQQKGSKITNLEVSSYILLLLVGKILYVQYKVGKVI